MSGNEFHLRIDGEESSMRAATRRKITASCTCTCTCTCSATTLLRCSRYLDHHTPFLSPFLPQKRLGDDGALELHCRPFVLQISRILWFLIAVLGRFHSNKVQCTFWDRMRLTGAFVLGKCFPLSTRTLFQASQVGCMRSCTSSPRLC